MPGLVSTATGSPDHACDTTMPAPTSPAVMAVGQATGGDLCQYPARRSGRHRTVEVVGSVVAASRDRQVGGHEDTGSEEDELHWLTGEHRVPDACAFVGGLAQVDGDEQRSQRREAEEQRVAEELAALESDEAAELDKARLGLWRSGDHGHGTHAAARVSSLPTSSRYASSRVAAMTSAPVGGYPMWRNRPSAARQDSSARESGSSLTHTRPRGSIHESLWRACVEHLPVVEHNQRGAQRADVLGEVSRQDDGGVGGNARHHLAEPESLLGIEPCGRLVEHDQLGAAQQRLGQRQPSTHTARERSHLGRRTIGEPYLLQHATHLAMPFGSVGHLLQQGHVVDELERGEPSVESGLLWEIAEAPDALLDGHPPSSG